MLVDSTQLRASTAIFSIFFTASLKSSDNEMPNADRNERFLEASAISFIELNFLKSSIVICKRAEEAAFLWVGLFEDTNSISDKPFSRF